MPEQIVDVKVNIEIPFINPQLVFLQPDLRPHMCVCLWACLCVRKYPLVKVRVCLQILPLGFGSK